MRHLFFDLDGTLTDPKLGITRCIQHALAELGEDVPHADTLTWCIGPPLKDSFATLVGAARADAAVALYRDRFAEIGLYENELYHGIREMLRDLAVTEATLCVASSKPLIFVEQILEHFALRDFFVDVFGSELDGTRTDKGELLAHALQARAAQAEACVMIGDRKHDAIGAAKNGLDFVGVLYGYGDHAELSGAGAVRFAEEPAALVSILR